MRGISLHSSLRDLGYLWRKSPVDLPEEALGSVGHKAGTATESLSLHPANTCFTSLQGATTPLRPVEACGQLRHLPVTHLADTGQAAQLRSTSTCCPRWIAFGRYKVLSLLFQAGWKHMLLCWFFGVVLAGLLSSLGVLPMPLSISPEWPDYHSHSCPFFPWCLLTGFVGSFVGLLLTPYFPNCCGHQPVCFLDVVSIHQAVGEPKLSCTQPHTCVASPLPPGGPRPHGEGHLWPGWLFARQQGAAGALVGPIPVQAWWTVSFSNRQHTSLLVRLWCVFELAAYRMANPDGRMVLAPLFVEAGVLLCSGSCFQ